MKLEAIKIEKSYGSRKVVNGVDLELKQGEIVGLLGPNGAGKTTCFYTIVGLIKPDNGKILINNIDISKEAMYKRAKLGIGYLAQEASVFRKLTVEENIKAVLELTEKSKEQQNEDLENLIDEFSLQKVRKNRGDLLSGGERRLLEISRALVMKPSILLVDEPSIGLEPRYINMVFDILGDLQKNENKTIILVEQNAKKGLEFADIGYVLVSGQTAIAGKGNDLLKNPDVGRLFLGG